MNEKTWKTIKRICYPVIFIIGIITGRRIASGSESGFNSRTAGKTERELQRADELITSALTQLNELDSITRAITEDATGSVNAIGKARNAAIRTTNTIRALGSELEQAQSEARELEYYYKKYTELTEECARISNELIKRTSSTPEEADDTDSFGNTHHDNKHIVNAAIDVQVKTR